MNGKNLSENLKNLVILSLAVLGTVLMLSESVNAYSESNGTCECDSCNDCTNALNDNACVTVKLTKDVIDNPVTCINNPSNFNNKIFDCQGHIIDGSEDGYGIYIYREKSNNTNNTIKNCVITGFYKGIYLDFSSNNTLINNTANDNEYSGIYLKISSNNTLINNTANDNRIGIFLEFSSNNIMKNNIMKNNSYDFGINGWRISDFYQDIDTSNLVDDKPIYYWTTEKNAPNNCKNAEINESTNTGFVALVSCDNITVKNLNLHNNGHGILLVNTTNSKILNTTENDMGNNGIYLHYSSNNTLINNIGNNNAWGIYLDSSSNNTLINNTENNNDLDGIYLSWSSHNILTSNTANNNEYGIYLSSSSNYNILINNTANDNKDDGIHLFSCLNNTLTKNIACENSKYDIYNEGSGNVGKNNTCNRTYNYNDISTTVGCKNKCIEHVSSKLTSSTVKEKTKCGNGKCEVGETKENCSIDCSKSSDNMLLIIVGILIVILLIAAHYFLAMKKKKKQEERAVVKTN